MLQAYTNNYTLVSDSAIPLNNIVIQKGCTAELAAPASIELNKAGIYCVHCDAIISATAAGDGTIQMSKNGVASPFAKASETLIADANSDLSFETLVQVPFNNTCCCLTSPVTLQFIYTGAAGSVDINVVVTKIC